MPRALAGPWSAAALLAFAVAGARPAPAGVVMQAIGRPQGLPSSQVHAVALGPDGFLWAAGPSGLARYDGAVVRVFDRSDGLSATGLRSLARDRAGRMLVGSDRGLDRVTRDLGEFSVEKIDGWSQGLVESLAVGAAGTVWIGGAHGLYRWDELEPPLRVAEVPGTLIADLAVATDGSVWAVGPQLGVMRGTGASWAPPKDEGWKAVLPVRTVAAGPEGGVFVGGDDGVLWLDSEGHVLATVVAPGAGTPVREVAWLGGVLWVSFEDRITTFDLDAEGPRSRTAVPSDSANDFVADRQGNVWIGTEGSGVLKASLLGRSIDRVDGPCPGSVMSVTESAGTLLVGGTGCSWRMAHDPAAPAERVAVLDGYRVWDALEDDAGLWIATDQGVLRASGGSVVRPVAGLNEPSRRLIQTDAGLLVGAVSGLFLAVGDGADEILDADGASLGYVYSMATRFDDVLVGTLGRGLWRWSPAGGGPPTRVDGSAPDSSIYAVAAIEGVGVAMSSNEAIVLIDGGGERRRVERGEITWTLVADGDTLWAGGSSGLTAFLLPSLEAERHVPATAGLAGDEFTTSRSLYLDPAGRLWCGMDGGLAVVDAQALGELPRLPPPVLSETQWRGQRPELGDGVRRFEVGNWTASLRVAVPWFVDERSVRYRWRLGGFLEEWSGLGPTSQAIQFTSLPVGRYRLAAQSYSPLVGWSEPSELLEIDVYRPWWKLPRATWLAIGLAGLLIAFALARTLTQRRIRRRLERQVAERTAELEVAAGKLERLAWFDSLTELPNQRAFQEESLRFAERAQRSGEGFSLIVGDIDRFKKINDRWGHDAGDTVLRGVAERLASVVRKQDFLARYGGEEFVVLAWNRVPEEVNVEAAERLHAALDAAPFDLGNGESRAVTASFGVARWLGEQDTPRALFRRADRALYRAKETRNKVVAEA